MALPQQWNFIANDIVFTLRVELVGVFASAKNGSSTSLEISFAHLVENIFLSGGVSHEPLGRAEVSSNLKHEGTAIV